MTEKKQCGVCHEYKLLDDFYDKKRSKTRKDGTVHKWVGKYSACKKCTDGHNKEARHKYDQYYKEYRAKNKQRQSELSKVHYIDKHVQWVALIETKVELKCEHCGYDEHFAALDFHHTDKSAKETTIHSIMKSGRPTEKRWEQMQKELAKCIVLCSNCHRVEHSKYNWLDSGEKMVKAYKEK